MSSGEVRRVSRQDIQLVQNLIEQCIQLHMSRKEAVNTLLERAKIEPGFTELVWQKLEEENREFFDAYYLRLALRNQVDIFNRLLEKQFELMQQVQSTGVAPEPTIPNGSCMTQFQPNTACYTPDTGPPVKQESLHPTVSPSLPHPFTNGMPSLHSTVPTASSSRIDFFPNTVLVQSANSNMGVIQGMNGGMIKSENGYSSNSHIMFGSEGNVLEMHQTIGDGSVASFSEIDSSSQTLNESLFDDPSSFPLLGQIPRPFSLGDLTAGYSHCAHSFTDVLENYPRSPFLATDADNFLDAHGRGELQDESKRLDTISEGLNSYDDFGSD